MIGLGVLFGAIIAFLALIWLFFYEGGQKVLEAIVFCVFIVAVPIAALLMIYELGKAVTS